MLDTHVLIWAVSESSRLDAPTRAAIAAQGNIVAVSAATAWEIAIRRALGRLEFPIDRFNEVVAVMRLEQLPIRASHAIAAGALPRHHDDPFDRMLIAQARLEQLLLVTDDPVFARYDVPIFGGSSG